MKGCASVMPRTRVVLHCNICPMAFTATRAHCALIGSSRISLLRCVSATPYPTATYGWQAYRSLYTLPKSTLRDET